jgi:hypothetical protein
MAHNIAYIYQPGEPDSVQEHQNNESVTFITSNDVWVCSHENGANNGTYMPLSQTGCCMRRF